jgi:hypothetical protein
VSHVVQALPDCLVNIGAGSDIEQPLVRFSILHYSLGFAVDGQYYRPLALLELLEELGRLAPKVCQRLNVFRDVEIC